MLLPIPVYRLFQYTFGHPENRWAALSLYNTLGLSDLTNPDDISVRHMDYGLVIRMEGHSPLYILDCLDLPIHIHWLRAPFGRRIPRGVYRDFLFVIQELGKERYVLEMETYVPWMERPYPRCALLHNRNLLTPWEKGMLDFLVCELPIIPVSFVQADGDANLRECRPLSEFAWYVQKVRAELDDCAGDPKEAVNAIIGSMPRDSALRQFFQAHRETAVTLTLKDYRQEWEEECWADGDQEAFDVMCRVCEAMSCDEEEAFQEDSLSALGIALDIPKEKLDQVRNAWLMGRIGGCEAAALLLGDMDDGDVLD